MTWSVDINCDLGEGVGNEAALMPLLSSCNIACGVHAGDVSTMNETVRLAINHHTKIGAHPSFPDRENFGRVEMRLPKAELVRVISSQIDSIGQVINKLGGKLHHVKPHGALYNMASVDEETADAVLSAMTEKSSGAVLYVPYGSVIAKMALERSVPIRYEAFADRNYNDDLTLVSRKLPNATLHDSDQILTHVLRMVKENRVKTIKGNEKKIIAQTVCIHGDNPDAVTIVSDLWHQLKANGVTVEKS